MIDNVHHVYLCVVRLGVLQEEWVRGKRCLDIGCNAGIFTMLLAKTLYVMCHMSCLTLSTLSYWQFICLFINVPAHIYIRC